MAVRKTRGSFKNLTRARRFACSDFTLCLISPPTPTPTPKLLQAKREAFAANNFMGEKIELKDDKKKRAYASTRDWDAIDRDLKKQEEENKGEGEEALNGLFKQIYGDADEDTRR